MTPHSSSRKDNHLGYWLLATGYWLLATGYWLLATGYWLLATGYWLPSSQSSAAPPANTPPDHPARFANILRARHTHPAPPACSARPSSARTIPPTAHRNDTSPKQSPPPEAPAILRIRRTTRPTPAQFPNSESTAPGS